jgi:hypothetical protein
MPVGPSLDWHITRTGELEAVLQRAGCEDFVVDNDVDRLVRDVAVEVVLRAGWIDG